jgi:excisionase family DNA binding protein
VTKLHPTADPTTPSSAVSSAVRIEPFAVSVAEACRISGISRSELYRRLAANKIKAVKCGTRTLILLDSLRQHLGSLPTAKFARRRDTGMPVVTPGEGV